MDCTLTSHSLVCALIKCRPCARGDWQGDRWPTACGGGQEEPALHWRRDPRDPESSQHCAFKSSPHHKLWCAFPGFLHPKGTAVAYWCYMLMFVGEDVYRVFTTINHTVYKPLYIILCNFIKQTLGFLVKNIHQITLKDSKMPVHSQLRLSSDFCLVIYKLY